MSDHIQKTLDDALADLRKHEDAVLSGKKFINQLCGFGKMPIMFPDVEQEQGIQRAGIRRNSFYGQPLATCVGEYLEWRLATGLVKEATLDEIVGALRDGGFDLTTVSKDGDGQKRGVAITLGKNTTKFHRLPNGDFGLLVWYPNVKAKKAEARNADTGSMTAAPTPTETALEDQNAL